MDWRAVGSPFLGGSCVVVGVSSSLRAHCLFLLECALCGEQELHEYGNETGSTLLISPFIKGRGNISIESGKGLCLGACGSRVRPVPAGGSVGWSVTKGVRGTGRRDFSLPSVVLSFTPIQTW